MATGLSLSRRQLALDWLFNTQATTQPTTLAASLHTGDPGDTGASNEVTNAGAYARVTTNVTAGSTNWNTATAANPTVLTNKLAITWTTASAQWSAGAAITHFGIYDSATYGAGNLVVRGTVTPNTNVINSGNTPSFAAGQLSITLAPT